jgi:GNAT superfamily N-acetyltransferase
VFDDVIRLMTESDLDALTVLCRTAPGGTVSDSREVFARRLHFFPGGCSVVHKEGKLAGYLVSHPWALHKIPASEGELDIPHRLDCYYVHGLAVAPFARGVGAGRVLLERALAIARERGFRIVASTAGQAWEPFWSKFGFRASCSGPSLLKARLRDLGPEARYLIFSGGPY